MRYLRYFALLTLLMVPFAYSQAQVRVGIGVGAVSYTHLTLPTILRV